MYYSLDTLDVLHKELDAILENSNDVFISDWNCDNSLVKLHKPNTIEQIALGKYYYLQSDLELKHLIQSFHIKNENFSYKPEQILATNGSSTIISSFFIWLVKNNYTFVYYIPPLYFTFHFFAKIFNIKLRPLSKDQLFDNNININFPIKKSLLIITDPIWFAGHSIKRKTISSICEWQRATDSLVFVDGSFQFMKWNLSKREHSSLLNNEKTFRLICPTKALSIHAYRFSYLLVPSCYSEEFNLIIDNLKGSSNFFEIVIAKKIMRILISSKANNNLISLIRSNYQLIKKYIITQVPNDCGYFIFAKIKDLDVAVVQMDERFFEVKGYKEYVRINLLLPNIRRVFKVH